MLRAVIALGGDGTGDERRSEHVEYRLNITAAGNTYNACLLILERKGYTLYSDADGDGPVDYYAEKDGVRFSATSPPELLGIAVLGEEFGADWNRQGPNVLRRVLDSGPPKTS